MHSPKALALALLCMACAPTAPITDLPRAESLEAPDQRVALGAAGNCHFGVCLRYDALRGEVAAPGRQSVPVPDGIAPRGGTVSAAEFVTLARRAQDAPVQAGSGRRGGGPGGGSAGRTADGASSGGFSS